MRDEVQQGETSLGKRLGASVTLLGFSDANGLGFRPVVRHDAAIAQGDAYDDATEVFRTGKGRFSFGTIAGVDNARAALPIKKGFVLVVRRPIDEIPSAVHAVRTAFLTAALAGLALTLILAIPLAGRIVAGLGACARRRCGWLRKGRMSRWRSTGRATRSETWRARLH